jgi:hypothetical protein
MLENDFDSLLVPLGLAGAYIASREGGILVRAGAFDDEAFSGLQSSPEGYFPWLSTKPCEIASMWEFLEGKDLPQSAAQGEAHVCLMRPLGMLIGVAGYVLPLGRADREKMALESYHRSKRIAETIDEFAKIHEQELTDRSNRSRVSRARHERGG